MEKEETSAPERGRAPVFGVEADFEEVEGFTGTRVAGEQIPCFVAKGDG
jgi:hypothetical protein